MGRPQPTQCLGDQLSTGNLHLFLHPIAVMQAQELAQGVQVAGLLYPSLVFIRSRPWKVDQGHK